MPFDGNKELFLVYEDNGYLYEDNRKDVRAVCFTREDAESFIEDELGFVQVIEGGISHWEKPWKDRYQDYYPNAFVEAVGLWKKGEE